MRKSFKVPQVVLRGRLQGAIKGRRLIEMLGKKFR